MKKILILIIASFLFFASNAQTDTDISLTLNEFIIKFLENNYQILISQKDLEISENTHSCGKAGRLPTVTAGVSDAPQAGDGNRAILKAGDA